jgi:tetratricopeptide (TPR) repeat protein
MNWQSIHEHLLSSNPEEASRLLDSTEFWTVTGDIYIRTVDLLRNNGRIDMALNFIDSILHKRADLGATTVKGLKHLQAECLHDQKKYKEAIAVYDDILRSVEDPTAYANKALAQWELGELECALINYQNSIKLNPADAVALRNVGELMNKREQFWEAIPYLNKSLDLEPNCPKTLCALGVAQFNLGNWTEAHRTLSRALTIDPENRIAKLGLRKIRDHFELSE